MSDKATPRPWCAFGRSIYPGGRRPEMPRRILRTDAHTGRGSVALAEANARLIVSAVNAYEAHQRAVQALRNQSPRVLLSSDGLPCWCSDYEARKAAHFDHSASCLECRAALAELDKVTRS